MLDLESLKYPIGQYDPPTTITAPQIKVWIEELTIFPQELSDFVKELTAAELQNSYRPGGWTGNQVINHLADSHINAYTRFHLTLTEEKPAIRPYFEDRWAELPDGKTPDIQLSIAILKSVHARLVLLLNALTLDKFSRTYVHPETQKENSMFYLLGNYAWHGKHHLAHLKLIKS